MKTITTIIHDCDETEIDEYISSTPVRRIENDVPWRKLVAHERADFLLNKFKFCLSTRLLKKHQHILDDLFGRRGDNDAKIDTAKLAHLAPFMTEKMLEPYLNNIRIQLSQEIIDAFGNNRQHLESFMNNLQSIYRGRASIIKILNDPEAVTNDVSIDEYIRSRSPSQIINEVPWRKLFAHEHAGYLIGKFSFYLSTNLLKKHQHILTNLFKGKPDNTIDEVKLAFVAPHLTRELLYQHHLTISERSLTAKVWLLLQPFLPIDSLWSTYLSGITHGSIDHIKSFITINEGETDVDVVERMKGGWSHVLDFVVKHMIATVFIDVIVDQKSDDIKTSFLRELDFCGMSSTFFGYVVKLLDSNSIKTYIRHSSSIRVLPIYEALIYNNTLFESLDLFPFSLYTSKMMNDLSHDVSGTTTWGKLGNKYKSCEDLRGNVLSKPHLIKFIQKFLHCVDNQFYSSKLGKSYVVQAFCEDGAVFDQMIANMGDDKPSIHKFLYGCMSRFTAINHYNYVNVRQFINYTLDNDLIVFNFIHSNNHNNNNNLVKLRQGIHTFVGQCYTKFSHDPILFHELLSHLVRSLSHDPNHVKIISSVHFFKEISGWADEFQQYFKDIVELDYAVDNVVKAMDFIKIFVSAGDLDAARDGDISSITQNPSINLKMLKHVIVVARIFNSRDKLISSIDSVVINPENARRVADVIVSLGVETEDDIEFIEKIMNKVAEFIDVIECSACWCKKHEFLVLHTDSRGVDHTICIDCWHKTMDRTRCTVCNISLQQA